MCHRFTMLTHDEVEDVMRAIECGVRPEWEPDWPARSPRDDAFPGASARIIAQGASGGLASTDAVWGFSAPWAKRPVFNTRIETALSPGGTMWSSAIAQGRCIVPAVRFFETQNRFGYDGTFEQGAVGAKKRRNSYSFGMPDAAPVLLAGVRQDGRFSIVTTRPNESVAPVHDRMPLVLSWHEAWRWLGDGFASLADRIGIALEARLGRRPLRPDASIGGQMSLF